MLTKDQALAAMDAHIIRAEAEQRRRLEQRVGRLLVLYPALRGIALEERTALYEEANRHLRRSWTLYAALALIVAAWSVYLFQEQLFGSKLNIPPVALMPASVALPGFVVYLHRRAWLKRLVAKRDRRRAQPGHG